MAEVKECDRAMVADAEFLGDRWRDHRVVVAQGVRDWVTNGGEYLAVHARHAEQYARQREEIERLRERAEKAEADLKNAHAKALDRAVAAEAARNELRERAEKAEDALGIARGRLGRAEADLAKARQKLSLLEAGPDDYTPEQSLQFSMQRRHEAVVRELVEAEAERDDLRDKLDRTLRELEELRVKARPSRELVAFAQQIEHVQRGPMMQKACDFILSLAPAPKRKTRLEAAGIESPDEEMPEEP